VVLLFVVYELFVTDLVAAGEQADLSEQLRHEWSAGPVADRPAVPGDALAVLYLPRLGADYRRVVLEGTAEQELSKGPGHYPGTAMPGERGNLAIAGHRVGRGSPFLDLDRLRPGDAIVVETADTWFVYRVLGDRDTGSFQGDPSGIPGREIVRPTDVDVISPVPGGRADAAPDGAWLTLTTCHPKYSAEQRLVIHAVLTDEGALKTDAPDGPPALRED
jgi:sortase (surface protein transpeptidase)